MCLSFRRCYTFLGFGFKFRIVSWYKLFAFESDSVLNQYYLAIAYRSTPSKQVFDSKASIIHSFGEEAGGSLANSSCLFCVNSKFGENFLNLLNFLNSAKVAVVDF